MEPAMHRSDLDFLHLEGGVETRTEDPGRQEPEQNNSPRQVLWETGLVLASALSLVALIDLAFAFLHIG
jgi:hypothetical protein